MAENGGRFVRIDGHRIHIEEAGEGYPVICLHGGGPGAGGRGNFRCNVDAVSARYRMILMDMPNFGKSDMIVSDKGRLSLCADKIRGLMDELGIPKAHFIGNSMGAQSVFKFALDHPDRIDRFVAIGNTTYTRTFFQPRPAEGIKLIAEYYRGEGPSEEKMRTLLTTIVYDPSFITDQIVKERFAASAEPRVVELWSNNPPKPEDISDRLHEVRCPVLLMWGAQDRFSSLDSGLAMVNILADARMHIFPRCGHWVQVEWAEEFNELALAFLGRDS